MSAANWSCGEVRSWLIDQGFEEYSELLCDQHEVDGEVLLSLTEIVNEFFYASNSCKID